MKPIFVLKSANFGVFEVIVHNEELRNWLCDMLSLPMTKEFHLDREMFLEFMQYVATLSTVYNVTGDLIQLKWK